MPAGRRPPPVCWRFDEPPKQVFPAPERGNPAASWEASLPASRGRSPQPGRGPRSPGGFVATTWRNEMKSRVIAAGATVIALALGGPAQAMAAGPGELVSPVTGHTEATVNSPAGKVTVEGNVKTPPVALPSPKKPHAGEVKP